MIYVSLYFFPFAGLPFYSFDAYVQWDKKSNFEETIWRKTVVISTLNQDQNPLDTYRFVFLVIALGIVIRLFTCEYTYIINSDGVLYVHQARALYYNELDCLYNCGLDYLSIYPRCIAVFYQLTGDFLTAAITVSALFGCLTLIPIFLLSRHFFSIQTSGFVTLIFALLPIFVSRSADVLRGPACWFFLAWGILAFIQYVDNKKLPYLLLSITCFICATWSRIEAVVIFPSMILFLFLFSKNKKRVLLICMFTTALLIIMGFFLEFFYDISLLKIYRLDEVVGKFIEPYQQYNFLRDSLEKRLTKKPMEFADHFMVNARHQIHFVAFGTFISNACEAFFYPFLLFFILGFYQIGKKLKADPRLWFFIIIAFSGVCIVYVHLVQHWMIEYRYFALIIISTSIFAGFGIEQAQLLLTKCRMQSSQALIIILVFILLFGLVKNLKPREKDKYIFRQMGELIAQMESDKPIMVTSVEQSTNCEKVQFYANRSHEGVLCPRQFFSLILLSDNNYSKLVHEISQRNAHYFLWESRLWPDDWFDFNKAYLKTDFIPIISSQASGNNTLVLYKFVRQTK
jgi:4-amino-4-deoxy-L-arabinose transferase-like glycosyltransferase